MVSVFSEIIISYNCELVYNKTAESDQRSLSASFYGYFGIALCQRKRMDAASAPARHHDLALDFLQDHNCTILIAVLLNF